MPRRGAEPRGDRGRPPRILERAEERRNGLRVKGGMPVSRGKSEGNSFEKRRTPTQPVLGKIVDSAQCFGLIERLGSLRVWGSDRADMAISPENVARPGMPWPGLTPAGASIGLGIHIIGTVKITIIASTAHCGVSQNDGF